MGKSLLQSMVREAFNTGDTLRKEADDEQQKVDPDELLKLADGLEHVAQALATENLPPELSPMQWMADGDEEAALTAAELGQVAFSPPGVLGQVPSGERDPDNLGGDLPISNEFGIVTASLRKQARDRASAAQARVLGKIKAAAMRRTASEDPAMTGNLPAELSSTGEPPVTSEPATPAADVPQSTEAVMGLDNQQADKANKPEEAAILGDKAVQAATASDPAPDVLDHSTGDEEPTVQSAKHAAILRSAVLANIARGG